MENIYRNETGNHIFLAKCSGMHNESGPTLKNNDEFA